mmetsp:Transcript_16235/g.13825  ORF Transcript_16235/g.13825 Transcript_16235/m.13825 type:complete len:201 (+) Transcript_16235:1789-2391(+)
MLKLSSISDNLISFFFCCNSLLLSQLLLSCHQILMLFSLILKLINKGLQLSIFNLQILNLLTTRFIIALEQIILILKSLQFILLLSNLVLRLIQIDSDLLILNLKTSHLIMKQLCIMFKVLAKPLLHILKLRRLHVKFSLILFILTKLSLNHIKNLIPTQRSTNFSKLELIGNLGELSYKVFKVALELKASRFSFFKLLG